MQFISTFDLLVLNYTKELLYLYDLLEFVDSSVFNTYLPRQQFLKQDR